MAMRFSHRASPVGILDWNRIQSILVDKRKVLTVRSPLDAFGKVSILSSLILHGLYPTQSSPVLAIRATDPEVGPVNVNHLPHARLAVPNRAHLVMIEHPGEFCSIGGEFHRLQLKVLRHAHRHHLGR